MTAAATLVALDAIDDVCLGLAGLGGLLGDVVCGVGINCCC